jgi:hypothetical protein
MSVPPHTINIEEFESPQTKLEEAEAMETRHESGLYSHNISTRYIMCRMFVLRSTLKPHPEMGTIFERSIEEVTFGDLVAQQMSSDVRDVISPGRGVTGVTLLLNKDYCNVPTITIRKFTALIKDSTGISVSVSLADMDHLYQPYRDWSVLSGISSLTFSRTHVLIQFYDCPNQRLYLKKVEYYILRRFIFLFYKLKVILKVLPPPSKRRRVDLDATVEIVLDD